VNQGHLFGPDTHSENLDGTIKLCVLASSSSGNCILVASGGTRILIDTGNLPIRTYIQRNLNQLGLDYDHIDALFITHAHSDHLNANTFSISYRNRIPMYVHTAVMNRLQRNNPERFPFYSRCRKAGLFSLFGLREVKLNDLRICPFELPHDSPNTVGFTIRNPAGKLAVATDLGCAPDHILRRFEDSDVIVMESNHDPAMEKSSGRSRLVIERNLGDRGHLSNEQAQRALERILDRSTRPPSHLFLAHLSQECNTPRLAYEGMQRLLARAARPVRLELTYPRTPSACVEI
jgi:phosphoribosyl 1,2-cyclic phosphodiesterase